ncbi:5'-nucleotidase, exopolyphosphatase, 3'-nucleotidase [Bernardetia litoralis DSM 6794]|uniref:5'-nucleotidase SurE n=1 Tax=Bernardetia litoralis (strain ATCC 23117 / DSM 6794 / NBRC 15988 / NCIMB 1366 / Fx l1 / Sio-4) TaxID=880071 RepID=I4ALT2_BERLS|nr:5'/3'-nucleotidase SurE [Bernardetia litoralis]AFM04917.1 5'-nucleotidase, exopolyphosphatase, 3'-nucleotidase [Bernardetia litoralis DSM 6794]
MQKAEKSQETNNTKKSLILVSNDDGITAKGIRELVEMMTLLGEVIVVAPDSPQSGMGHAITIHMPLKVRKSDVFKDLGVEAYECSGTPADCVKLAKFHIFKNRTPDLVVSGVNHGSNTSISVLYSGTMSAAIEGAIEGLPSIGFSLCDYGENADFSHVRPHILKIAEQTLKKGLPKNVALNVNFPARFDKETKEEQEIKGTKICRQAHARWQEKFDLRTDPYGREYLWLAGDFVNPDKGEDTDEWAVNNGYISIVPCQFDMTAHHGITYINNEWDI